MGVVVDTSILVSYERRGGSVAQMVEHLATLYPQQPLSISVMTVAELTHGVYRSPNIAISNLRQQFLDRLCRTLTVEPVSLPLARLIGRIEGEQAAKGLAIDLPDLIIGATALHLGHTLLTLNPKHFTLIPGLTVQSL